MAQFLDSVTLDGVKETDAGYLVADAFAVRTGVQRYTGSEVGRPDLVFVDVYRPENEVFSHATLASFSHVPVTDDHPTVAVTKDNWKDLAVGEASTDVLRDGHRMKIPLIVKDHATIAKIQSGKRELSAGYTCDLAFENGTTNDGVTYQAVQKNIRANHIAVVARGRAGPEFRFGDAAPWGAAPITMDKESPTMTTRTIMVDGISILTTDQGAEAIAKLQGQLADAGGNLVAATTLHTTELATRDSKIGELTAQLADAQKKVLDGAALDAAVTARATLIGDAQKIAKDAKFEGLTDADIRRTAVTARYGEALTKDMSDDVVAGMFRAATADAAKVDPVRQAIVADARQPTQSLTQDRGQSLTQDRGQSTYENGLTNNWKTPAAA